MDIENQSNNSELYKKAATL